MSARVTRPEIRAVGPACAHVSVLCIECREFYERGTQTFEHHPDCRTIVKTTCPHCGKVTCSFVEWEDRK